MVRCKFAKAMVGLCLFGAPTTAVLVAQASEPAPLVSLEKTLTPAEIKKAVDRQTLVDSSLAILNAPAKTAAIGGMTAAPAPTTTDRMALSGQQLLSDIGHSAAQVLPGDSTPARQGATDVSVEAGTLHTATVFGTDDRTQVTNTQSTPYKAISQIQISWPNGSGATATAEFVSPRVLLTNAHCVYLNDKGGWAKSVKIVPGKNGSSEPYGSQYAQTYYVPSAWLTSGATQNSVNPDLDIAWLILPDKTLFNRTGYYFGYQTTSDSSLATYLLNMAGYPNDGKGTGKNGINMWFQYGGGNQVVYASQYKHYLDTNPGSSGSPMWLYFTSGATPGRFIVGVNDAENSSSNFATRMTSSYFSTTQQLSAQYP